MEFNADKFEGVRYGNKDKQHYLAPNDKPIKQPVMVKDLGIIMAVDLNFQQHIKNIVAKGLRMDGYSGPLNLEM